MKNKCVEILENPEAGDRCPCRLLDLYIDKLPMEAKDKDLFYVRPVEKPKQGAAWYYSIPIGRNKLAQMVPEMCRIGGISGHETNHSFRATGTTELYEAEVPEKIIQERTGHRSLECLRMYERTSEKQHQAVSNILSSSSQSTYHTQITKIDSQNIATSSNMTGLLPKMNFANCQVNVNINQGSAAPVNFNNTSHAESSDFVMPSTEELLEFLKDMD